MKFIHAKFDVTLLLIDTPDYRPESVRNVVKDGPLELSQIDGRNGVVKG